VPDLPAALTRAGDIHDLWRDPGLVFGQTCWGPMRLGLARHVRVLAQPDYSDVEGGRGPFYRSALVARAPVGGAADLPPPATPGAQLPLPSALAPRLAFNGRDSMSGWIALSQDAGDPGNWAAALLETGAHRASLQAVAEGRADLAAIDCRSWALARRHEPCTRGLVVIGWTAERLGLPYVTARDTDDQFARRLTAALIGLGAHAPQTGDTQ
jgi:ABC-type phosphate/phosphonate transport system substrate-binding protein